MTASHGVGTYGNAIGTVTPNDHKLGNAASFAKSTSSLAIRTGIFWGGQDNIVTGTSGMTYNVAAFTAVISRGATSGAIPIANDGVVNIATTAAPGSNSRYDVVYIWQREFSIDGVDSNPVIGVLQGTVAASPTVPALTAFPGAIALANILVPAGVTATNTGTTITQVGPFTAASGGVVMFRNSTEQAASILPQGTLSVLVASNTLYVSDGSQWVASGGKPEWGVNGSTTIATANGSGALLSPWDAVGNDLGNTINGAFTLVRATGIFTCARAGTYDFNLDVQFAVSGAGNRVCYYSKALAATPSTFVIGPMSSGGTVPAGGFVSEATGHWIVPMAVGDNIEFNALQSSGGALNITGAHVFIKQLL